ncbi:MAG: flagellar protein FlgN [Phycisphaerales bacterium]|nr:flagellar protein FlgN [Phycisphaerales bacterium]
MTASNHFAGSHAGLKLTGVAPAKPLCEDLRDLLIAFLERHEALLRHTKQHHEAIRQADVRRCEQIVRDEQATLAAIADLELKRQSLVARAMREIVPTPKSLTRLSDIALHCPDATRPELLELSARLRRTIENLQQEQNLLRVVSRVLMAHMEGLMRQVARTLSHAGIYGQRGVVASSQIVTSLDVRL